MMTLTEFLLARIAEDETDLPIGILDEGEHRKPGWSVARHGETTTARRFISRQRAECEAKRRVVAACERLAADASEAAAGMSLRERWLADTCARTILRDLAFPYADHPDYRPEWRRPYDESPPPR